MNVRELIEWLQNFEDQEATVEVVNSDGASVEFNPEEHAEYTDLRGNPWCKGSPWEDKRTLILGREA